MDDKFYFLWIPRTGGTTMWKAIEDSGYTNFRTSGRPMEFDNDAKYLTFQHTKIEKFRTRKIFTILRNPVDRIASVYFHLKNGRVDQKAELRKYATSWEEYIDVVTSDGILKVDKKESMRGLSYANPAEQWILDDKGNMIPDLILFTEKITEQWDGICEILQFNKKIECTQSNKVHGVKNYLYMYNDEQIKAMQEKFSYEIENFYPECLNK